MMNLIQFEMIVRKIDRNFVTIYIREGYKPIFEKFLELIKDDKEMNKLQDQHRPQNYLSTSIVQLMHNYNQKRIAELKAEKNETSN